mmetsp:Transcript_47209/g.119513  ORF Transcript_47209/g.119513 Transcript_47209/m.119513 type:complete len:304 (+) Transcript_47209:105-1016(+)
MASRLMGGLRICIPSTLTIGALVSGLTAVRFASEQDFQSSVTCILLACVLDGLDGHVARYLNACTKLGFELDSLCDCANFGVVPALVVYFWAKALPTVECRSDHCASELRMLWLSCCCYSSCCALRLARFNVEGRADEMDKSYLQPSEDKRPQVRKAVVHNFLQRKLYFHGVPAPMGAAHALTPMMLRLSESSQILGAVGVPDSWSIGRRGTAVTMIMTALLMVSPLPTFSSKMLKMDAEDSYLRSRHPLSRIAKASAFVLFCYLVWRCPFDLVLVLNLIHLISIPFGVLVFYGCASGDDKHE